MREYHAISADSHLEIPIDRWVHRIPAQYRDQAPKRIKLEGGGEAHAVEGGPMAVEPKRMEKARSWPRGGSFDANPGTGPPEQRLREQDMDGIDAEILYPGTSGPNLYRAIKDDVAYRAVVHAYNEWLAEEYCSVAPDRLLGLGLIPEMKVRGAIEELECCARMGLKGVMLNAFPNGEMYPTPEDDEFWAEAVRINMPVTAHIWFHHGAGLGNNYTGPLFQYERRPEGPIKSSMSDPIRRFIGPFGVRAAREAVRLIFAGVFDRFPTLQVYFAETQVGWIPQWLEHMDDSYQRNRGWAEELFGLAPLTRRPSEYVKEHCLWGFGNNPVGVELRHHIGVDRILWYTDFPHTGSDWPHSNETLDRNFAGVPDEERYQMVVGNAVRFFHLDET